MFLARREFGKMARVYELRGPIRYAWEFTFPGAQPDRVTPPISGPGHAVVAVTRDLALAKLHENDEMAQEEARG